MEALVGREAELGEVLAFARFSEVAALMLLLEGEAGIGKTTLWSAGVHKASIAGVQVRLSRPSEGEATFSFATVTDLLGELPDGVLTSLPMPQRRALEVVGLRRNRGKRPQEVHIVAAGFLSALRALGDGSPLLVGIDDIQWVDADSLTVLEFALRRIAPQDSIRFLFSRRTPEGWTSDLTRAVVNEQLRRINLSPLSLGAIEHLVHSRLGWSPSRYVARRIYEASGGNPLYALEFAAAVQRQGGRLESSDDLPMSATLMSLMASRLDETDAEVQRALLAVAISPGAPEVAIRKVLGSAEALDRAVQARLLVRDGDRLRLFHPLLGSTIRARAPTAIRRELHLHFSRVIDDPELRARHLALAITPPDARVANQLETASARATGRGASVAAAELAELAWRFTDPAKQSRWSVRFFVTIENLARAGLDEHGVQLLESEITRLGEGPMHARAVWWLDRMRMAEPHIAMLDDALLQADAATRAEILADKAFTVVLANVENLAGAHGWAVEAVELAQASGNGPLQATCITTLAWLEALEGSDVGASLDILDREVTDKLPGYDHPDRLRAARALWRGEIDLARRLLVSQEGRAQEREESWSEAVFILHRFELEQRVGDWLEAQRVLDRFERVAITFPDAAAAAINRCQAVLAAVRGNAGALVAATDAVLDPELEVPTWQRLEALRARGFGELVAGDYLSAVNDFTAVADVVEASGIREPGAFPLGADVIEALVGARQFEYARNALVRFESVSTDQSHPWGLAASARGRGIVLAQEGRTDEAVQAFDEAIERHGRLGLQFELARTQLALGILHRRSKRIADARVLLETAVAAFDRLGSPPLAARARGELARVGGRRRDEGLTATEERVAALIAQGLTNKEVATALFVTTSTVEAHLTRIYNKLGIHSRSELVRQTLLEISTRDSRQG